MSAANPYTPPRAEVRDVQEAPNGYQDIKLWSASGRIGRLRYLAYLSVGYVVMIAIGFGGGIIGGITHSAFLGPVIIGIAAIPYVIFSILMLIQRTHDMGWSGWAAFLTLIPFVVFIWFFKGGTRGDNQFGAPPPPNTRLVKIFALILPVGVIVVGILAAIAIPAYQQYTVRAKAAQLQAQ